MNCCTAPKLYTWQVLQFMGLSPLSLSCFFSSLVHIDACYISIFPLESICFETLNTFIGIISLLRKGILHLSPLQLFDKRFSVFRESVYEFVRDAVTKYNTTDLVAYTTEINFSQSWKLDLRPRYLQDWFFLRALSGGSVPRSSPWLIKGHLLPLFLIILPPYATLSKFFLVIRLPVILIGVHPNDLILI